MTAETRERAGQPHRSDGWSRATEAKGDGFNAEGGADEDDWAITPAGMPLEPMVVVDANGSELELQAGARAPRA